VAVDDVVVVADDDGDMRWLVAEMLRGALGVVVAGTCNGAEALDVLRVPGTNARVLLLDMQMPVLDGPETLRAIRSDPALRALPVVAMSGGGFEEAARAAGCDAFLRKPFGEDALVAALRPYLGAGA
jgi:two-component system cell cycle response regulator DivK